MRRSVLSRLYSNLSSKSATRLGTLDPNGSVFAEFTPLAVKHNAINLGQGFPNLEIPKFIQEAATSSITASTLMNQYTRSQGHLRLTKALSDKFSPKFDKEIDPTSEIVVTTGATEAIFSTMQAFISPGDEVVLMEPFYDSYPASVTMAGGKPVFVALKPTPSGSGKALSSDWKLDIQELKSKITKKTKMIVINTPHNPIGKMFTRQELEEVAQVAKDHDLLVLSDEVYETLVYKDSHPHVSISSIPGMFERTIAIGSVGKTFSVTGWKVGWAIGHKDLMRSLWMVHQFVTFSVTTPLQEATAIAFEKSKEEQYFEKFMFELEKKRDKLVRILDQAGLKPTVPEGSYFILADTSKIKLPEEFNKDRRRDFNVCRWLTSEMKVAAIPPSAFYSLEHEHMPSNLARFVFCKTDDMLNKAGENLVGKVSKYF